MMVHQGVILGKLGVVSIAKSSMGGCVGAMAGGLGITKIT